MMKKAYANTLRDILGYENYEVSDADSGITALEMLKQSEFDVILLDIKMPQMDGLEALDHILSEYETPVIMISGHGTIETAVEAIKKGAFDYIAKPLDLNRLLVTIRNALDKSRLLSETRFLKKKVSKKYEMIGESEVMKEIYEMIDRVAPYPCPCAYHRG